MFKEKDSFLKKMVNVINHDYEEDDERAEDAQDNKKDHTENDWMEEENNEGQLTIDMHQTPKEIIIHAMVAGVSPDDLDIDINREMVEIKGKRSRSKSTHTDDYFYQELYWGSFSRTIILPQEIEVEGSEAHVENGLLTISLPKIDKNKTQKLKVRK
ncbi:MAG: Hsp20/alpha crystallin family protein [Candidatus Paceibacterota bacterium]